MFAASPASSGYEWFNSFYADGCHRIKNSSGQSGYCPYGFVVLSVTFDTPTSFVSFETTWTSDPVWIYAYNSAGELVTSCKATVDCKNQWSSQTGTPGSRNFATVWVASAASDIAWVIAGSDNGIAGIDRMTFESASFEP